MQPKVELAKVEEVIEIIQDESAAPFLASTAEDAEDEEPVARAEGEAEAEEKE